MSSMYNKLEDLISNIDIEPTAFGRLLPFTESHDRIVKAGFERHISIQEYMALLILYLENKLNGPLSHLKTIAEQMLTNVEWCSQALEVSEDGKLTFYEGLTSFPIRLTSDDIYAKDQIKFSGNTSTFDISDLEPGPNHYSDIYGNHDDLIIYMHGRSFKQLPEEMRKESRIILPIEDIGPIAIGRHCKFSIRVGYYEGSRGVRTIKS